MKISYENTLSVFILRSGSMKCVLMLISVEMSQKLLNKSVAQPTDIVEFVM